MAIKQITVGGNITTPKQPAAPTIIQSAPKRFGKDIADYINAIRYASHIEYPQRVQLYNLYADVLLDTHLSSVKLHRKINAFSRKIEFWRDGKPDDTINEQLKSPWFNRAVEYIWEAQLYGFSLMQFYKKDGWINFTPIPRKNVNLYRDEILRREGENNGDAISSFPNMLFVGDSLDLGILASAIPWVLYKRGDTGDWATFAEVFGQPIREYIYPTDDEEARRKALKDMEDSGNNAAYIHSADTILKLLESANKSGSVDVYNKLFSVCNSELSKLFLLNTLTTEAEEKGTQSLGTVHKSIEELLAEHDRNFVLDVLNYEMTDIFTRLGLNTQGGEFCVPEIEAMTKKEKVDLYAKVKKDLELPIDEEFIYEELGIPKPKRVQQATKSPSPQVEPQEPPQARSQKSFFAVMRDFFAHASEHNGADSEW